MTLNERKALRTKIENGGRVTFQDAMNVFFLPEDQDAFARSMGWEDMEQMAYYENLAEQERVKREALILSIAPSFDMPPIVDPEIAELAKVDSREVYTDSEDCPPDDLRDLAGVY